MSWIGDLIKAGIESDGSNIDVFQGSINANGAIRAENKIVNLATVTTDTTADDITYSAAEIVGGLILRDPNGSGRSDTTATAAQIVAAINNATVGDSFFLIIRNTANAAETITVGGGTDVTISGTATIAQNNTKIFLVRLDNVTSGSEAVTIYSIGTLTH